MSDSAVPVKPSDAASLGSLIFAGAESGLSLDQLREHVTTGVSTLGLTGLTLYPTSLEATAHGFTVAVETDERSRYLLSLDPAGSQIANEGLPLGRFRPGGNREMHLTLLPFPQGMPLKCRPVPFGAEAGLVVLVEAERVPLALQTIKQIRTALAWGEHAVLSDPDEVCWQAMVSGLAMDYGVVQVVHGDRIRAQLASRVLLDQPELFDLRADHRSPHGWSEPDIVRVYRESIPSEVRESLEGHFRQPFDLAGEETQISHDVLVRMAVKFHRVLERTEALARAEAGCDLELNLVPARTLTKPLELLFCLEWARRRGFRVHSVAPNIAFLLDAPYPVDMDALVFYAQQGTWPDLGPRVGVKFAGDPLAELAERLQTLDKVAVHYGSILSIHYTGGKQPLVVETVARALQGRLQYWTPFTSAEEIVELAGRLRRFA